MVAAAHADGHRARAALHRLLPVRDEDGQVEDGLVLVRPAPPPRQDPRRVVCRETKRSGKGRDYRVKVQNCGQAESRWVGVMVRIQDLS